MRQLDIDPARGFSTAIDPSVAPNGALVRVENLRVDKDGRLVLRAGYTSLGTGIQNGPSANLIPRDLHTLDDSLLCLGAIHSSQSGIRAIAKYLPDANAAPWRVDANSVNVTGAALTNAFARITPADGVRIVTSETDATVDNRLTADAAVSTSGAYACMVSSDDVSSRIVIVDTATGLPVFTDVLASERNARVLFCGTSFYFFTQTGTTINVRTKDPLVTGPISGATAITAATSAAPAAYDVANFEGTTDWLIAFPTATGYTWRRYNSANVQQTTTSVVSLANAPVSICGATAETVNVVNVRAVSGVELRTFNPTTGVLSVGPTNVDAGGIVYEWLSVCRLSSTQVHVAYVSSAPSQLMANTIATTAAHALTQCVTHANVVQGTKTLTVDGRVFSWQTLGLETNRPYGLAMHSTSGSIGSNMLAATVFDGAARPLHVAGTVAYQPQLARVGQRLYTALVSLDPRDRTYRANLVTWTLFSGERRQSAQSGGQLYITGGMLTQYDGRLSPEVGFETAPVLSDPVDQAAGSMTPLAVYTFVGVFRAVGANGDVTFSEPGPPLTHTMGIGATSLQVDASLHYSQRTGALAQVDGVSTYLDIYRTEAGGSIPRFSQAILIGPATWGGTVTFTETNSDATIQQGALLYTQGADGDVSGRLPLGSPGPCGTIAESDGKLIAGLLPRANEVYLSVEKRPGEAASFVNDDIFFISNPERVRGISQGSAGRRYIFGANNIREIIGPGPNAAGVGEISEPVEVENRVGLTDWRSLCKTEHGTFFQSSAFGRPRIYLLLDAGGAVDASQGITDLLVQFPIVTSATRHDEEQLVTFTLQTADGTDGRILHLDLRTSGMGRNGWQGTWIVDRVAPLEAIQFPRILEERSQVFPALFGTQTIAVELPRGRRVGDRVLLIAYGPILSAATIAVGAVSGMVSTTIGTTAAGLLAQVIDLRQTSATDFQTSVSVTFTQGSATFSSALVFRLALIRGADPATAPVGSSVINAGTATWAIPALVPAWGSAKTLWIASAAGNQQFSELGAPVISGIPAGFSFASRRPTREGVSTTTIMDSVVCSRQAQTSSLSATFTTAVVGTVVGPGWLVAYRPLTTGGTPARASTRYRGRLVVCNSTDVLRSEAGAIADPSSAVILGEWEHADIHPMGPGGAGRHLATGLMFELLGETALYAWFSYDGGVTWSSVREFRFGPTYGFQLGTQCKVRWVPARRKIDRMRMRLMIADDTTAAAGATRGIALQRVTHWFEDLAGPGRRQTSTTANIGDRR